MRKLLKFRCPACDAVVESVLITQLQKQNAELLKAASAAEEFLRTFEPEWEILTDGDHRPQDAFQPDTIIQEHKGDQVSFNIEELDKLEASATKGPWQISDEEEPSIVIETANESPSPGVQVATVLDVSDFPCVEGEDADECRKECFASAELIVALRNAYPAMSARLRALEVEVRAWRDWSTFMPHSDRLTVEYTPVQRNAIRKASKATDATRRADDKRPKGGVT